MTIQAIWYQSACRAWKRTFRERSLYSSQTSRAPKGMRPTSSRSTLRWAIMDHVRSSCTLIVPAEALAWPSEARSRSLPRLGSCCILSPSVLIFAFACIHAYMYHHDTLQQTPVYPPNELFSDVLPSGGELPRPQGNNRIELGVIEVTQI